MVERYTGVDFMAAPLQRRQHFYCRFPVMGLSEDLSLTTYHRVRTDHQQLRLPFSDKIRRLRFLRKAAPRYPPLSDGTAPAPVHLPPSFLHFLLLCSGITENFSPICESSSRRRGDADASTSRDILLFCMSLLHFHMGFRNEYPCVPIFFLTLISCASLQNTSCAQ